MRVSIVCSLAFLMLGVGAGMLFSRGNSDERGADSELRTSGLDHAASARRKSEISSRVPKISSPKEAFEISSLSLRVSALQIYLETVPTDQLPGVLSQLEDEVRYLGDIEDPDAASFLHTSTELVVEAMVKRGARESLLNLEKGFLSDSPDSKNRSDSPQELYSQVMRKWAQQNPVATADFLKERTAWLDENDEFLRKELTTDLAKVWAKKDPDQALEWVRGLDEDLQGFALYGALAMLQFQNPERAAEVYEAHFKLTGDHQLGALISYSMVQQDPQRALKWAFELEAGEARGALAAVFDGWLKTDTFNAMKAFEELSGVHRDAAIGSLTHHLIQKEGGYSSAIELLEKEADGPGRREALVNMMSNWAHDDPVAAATWLREQYDEDESYDQASGALGRQLSEYDPEAGAVWVSSINDEQLRHERLRETMEAWFEKDPPAAIHWIKHSEDLSADDRSQLAAGFPAFFETGG